MNQYRKNDNEIPDQVRDDSVGIRNDASVFLCAGEPSGDLLGAELVAALLKQNPNFVLRGMGGEHMQKAGVELVVNCHDLAIVGLSEAIKQLPKIRRVMKKIVTDLENNRPDCLILIDYPGFNLNLAKKAKKLGIKVLYYSCPQIWAWHYSRIKKIKQRVDHMLTLFPFEEVMYQKENMPATFVGHPMVQRILPTITKEETYKKYNLDPSKPIVALLPGSRESEIKKLLPDILGAAQLIKKSIPDVQFVLPLADNLSEEWLTAAKKNPPDLQRKSTPFEKGGIKLIRSNRYDVLQCADAAIAVSGTATLELALLQIPMMIIYRVSALTYHIGKHIIRTNHFGLCNIVAGKEIAREALQKDANPENIAKEIIKLLENKTYRSGILSSMQQLKASMSETNAAEKASNLILNKLM